jgi:hypothetical protein
MFFSSFLFCFFWGFGSISTTSYVAPRFGSYNQGAETLRQSQPLRGGAGGLYKSYLLTLVGSRWPHPA